MITNQNDDNGIFVGRDDFIDWVQCELKTSNAQSILIGIAGIGGIGKTALLHELNRRNEYALYLNCRTGDFISKLTTLAKAARLKEIDTPRFDRLNEVRLWFLEGVQPASEKGKRWVKDLVDWIPVISSVAKIIIAIDTAGHKLKDAFREHFNEVGQWLRYEIGDNYGIDMLRILVESPQKTNDLFVRAIVEDLNRAVTPLDLPFLILLDSFEYVDDTRLLSVTNELDVKMTEAELWHYYLARLRGAVCVFAGRVLPNLTKKLGMIRKDRELAELNNENCLNLLKKRRVLNPSIQSSIANISRGNPFVIVTICDIADRGDLSLRDLEDLRSDSLLEVRERVWTLLFQRDQDLAKVIHYAAFLPFFDFRIIHVAFPTLDPTTWKAIARLSFVEYFEPYYHLHDLARELALGEFGQNLDFVAREIRNRFEMAFEKHGDPILLGMAFSADAVACEDRAIKGALKAAQTILDRHRPHVVLGMLICFRFKTGFGKAAIERLRGTALRKLNRFGEAEIALRDSLSEYRELMKTNPRAYEMYVAATLNTLAHILMDTGRTAEAVVLYRESLAIKRQLVKRPHPVYKRDLINGFISLAVALRRMDETEEAKGLYSQALEQARRWTAENPEEFLPMLSNVLNNQAVLTVSLGDLRRAEELFREALAIRSQLAQRNPTMFNPLKAETLHNLAELLARKGQDSEAVPMFEKALVIRSNLSEKSPEQFRPSMAQTQRNLASLLRKTGALQRAAELCQSSLATIRQLAEQEPDIFQSRVAATLDTLGSVERDRGNPEEAGRAYLESLSIRRQLAGSEPEVYMRELAIGLNKLGVFHFGLGKHHEAEEAYMESLEILNQVPPDGWYNSQPEKARVMHNLSRLLIQQNRITEAQAYCDSALDTRKKLAEEAPEIYLAQAADSMGVKSAILETNGQLQNSIESYLEGARTYVKAVELAKRIHARHARRFVAGAMRFIVRNRESFPDLGIASLLEVLRIYAQLVHIDSSIFQSDEIRALITLGWTYLDRGRTNEFVHTTLGITKRFLETKMSMTREEREILNRELWRYVANALQQMVSREDRDIILDSLDKFTKGISEQSGEDSAETKLLITSLHDIMTSMEKMSEEELRRKVEVIARELLGNDSDRLLDTLGSKNVGHSKS